MTTNYLASNSLNVELQCSKLHYNISFIIKFITINHIFLGISTKPPLEFYLPLEGSGDEHRSPFYGDPGESRENDVFDPPDEFSALERHFSPLYVHGMCRWPSCEVVLNDMANFVK